MKYLLMLLLASGTLYAGINNPISDTIISYYLAAKTENLDVFMKYTDTSNMTAEQISTTRQLLTDVWAKYKVDYHVIKNVVIYQDGDYAVATYTLDTTVSGAENLTYSVDYFMLLHRLNADWLVVYAMPIEDYAQAADRLAYATAVNAMLPAVRSSPSSGVMFNGLAMGDLNSSLQTGLNSCSTDDYCSSRGYLRCDNGSCTNTPKPIINNTANNTANITGNATNSTSNISINTTNHTLPANNTPPANNSMNTTPQDNATKQNITITISPSDLPPEVQSCLPSFVFIPLLLLVFARRLAVRSSER